MSRSLHRRTLTPPTLIIGGRGIFLSAMYRFMLVKLMPNFFAASRVEYPNIMVITFTRLFYGKSRGIFGNGYYSLRRLRAYWTARYVVDFSHLTNDKIFL